MSQNLYCQNNSLAFNCFNLLDSHCHIKRKECRVAYINSQNSEKKVSNSIDKAYALLIHSEMIRLVYTVLPGVDIVKVSSFIQ